MTAPLPSTGEGRKVVVHAALDHRPLCGADSTDVVTVFAFRRLYPELQCGDCLELIHS